MADLAALLKTEIAAMRPYLERSGARLEFVGVEDGIARVTVSLTRPGSSRLVVSLQVAAGIERALRARIPALRAVEAVNLPPYVLAGWDQPAAGLSPEDPGSR